MDPRYPIGKYETKTSLTPAERAEAITQIAETPKRMREAVSRLSGGQLDTPYRAGGWTVRQVAHHVPDSHMNAYIRMKLALTENEPTIKPYEEGLWADLPDSRETPIEVSLALLEFLHLRWDILLRSLPPLDFARRLPTSRPGGDDSGQPRPPLRMARTPPCRPHHFASPVRGLELTGVILTAVRYYWITAKGYRLRPWASPYIRWRLETFFGGDMHALGPAEFLRLIWRERNRLSRFLAWTAERWRVQKGDSIR